MKTTYTVKQIEPSSWMTDRDGNFAGVIYKWECGHKHTTLKGALKCLNSLSGTTRSIGARIEAADGRDIFEEIREIEDKEYFANRY